MKRPFRVRAPAMRARYFIDIYTAFACAYTLAREPHVEGITVEVRVDDRWRVLADEAVDRWLGKDDFQSVAAWLKIARRWKTGRELEP